VDFYDVSSLPGAALVDSEFSATISGLNPDGSAGAVFAQPIGPFAEHMNVITCPLVTGCTLTQGGYKNHFNSKLVDFPLGGLTLGTMFYSNSQLNSILQNNAIRGNGLLSLAHQLITAQLNIYYGATPDTPTALAIVQANALIDSLVIPPIGDGSLDPSVTSALETTLDSFNNRGPECQS
jgi:hypothetical protein